MLTIAARVRAVLHPKVILPLLLAAALLVFAFRLGDIGKVVGRLLELPLWVIGVSVGCAACYLGCKALQLKSMLNHIGVRIPARSFWLAFAVGETTVTLPLGLFSQNWVLSASRRIDIGRSSSATVMMLLVEIAAVFLFLAITGIPNLEGVRFGAIAALVFYSLLLAALLLFEDRMRELPDRLKHEWAQRAASSGVELIDGLRRLVKPYILMRYLVLAAIYLGALTTAFWMIGEGMGVHHLEYLDATQIYIFALAVILIGAGLISQIGTVDILGMVVARSFGIDYNNGLAMMLGFRIVWTGSIWLWCLPIVGVTWREIPKHGQQPSAEGSEEASR